MNYRPRCPHCRTLAQQARPFLAVTLDSLKASGLGFDPAMVSRVGFVCSSCDQTFPAVNKRARDGKSEINVLDADGLEWRQAAEWFPMVQLTAAIP